MVVQRFCTFCRNLFRKEQVDRELEEELRSYVELVAEEKMRCGTNQDQAWREARRDLGSLEQVKESVRDIKAGVVMDTFLQDFRYALRSLTRHPSFALVAILTLALGIGANTTMFTVVNSVLLKPLPYPQPDRLLMLWERQLSDGTLGTVAPANFVDWREQSHSFAQIAAIDSYPDFILNGQSEPKRLAGAAVSADFFSLLGVRMALGRDFLASEDRPGQNQVVILSHATWQHLGARPDVVGRQLTLNNISYTVVGVLPHDFSLVSKASDLSARQRFDVWTPLGLASPVPSWQRETHSLSVFARLKPGVTLPQAQADLNHVAATLQRSYPAADKERGITAVPWQQYVVANVRTALLVLLGAVLLMLLLACANIANLLLTRAAARQAEMSLRVALGASRWRLIQQLVTESVVLALLGGLLGLCFAWAGIPALVRHLPTDLPRTAEIAADSRVLAFTSLLSLVTGVLFGLVPAWQAQRVSANASLKAGGRSIAMGQTQLRSALIVGQVAVALVLLIGAGLLLKSFWTLLRVSPGFQVEHILTARLSLPPQYLNGYKFGTGQHRQIAAYQRELLERVRQIPGVQSAAFTAYLPLSGNDNAWGFEIEGRPPKPAGVYDVTKYRPVSPKYFQTIGIPMRRGRAFDERDNEDNPLVVMINQAMARTFWKGQNPIGQRVQFSRTKWRTIVGIVGDVRHEGLASKPEPELYVPYAQVPNTEARPTIVLRTATDPISMTSALRRAVAEVDPNVPLDQIATMKQMVSASVGQPRFRTALLVTFALLALLVASLGLYGVMSYVVSQRTREFGIRIAVGASRGAVLQLVLGQAAILVSLGLGLGWMGAILLTRAMASLLYGVTPFDAATFASLSILLTVVALLASYLPAQRAAATDPMESLRYE